MNLNSKDEIVLEFQSHADHEGKRTFFMYWWSDYIPTTNGESVAGVRGQIFRAKPDYYIKKCQEKSKKLKIIEYEGKE